MSDSRLEKFIYAICSMDVSDLPVPLSRIEKLWNCLITGETPDFEPLSRNEKYLMAMLDRYDISNLPAPMSRGEKLLYKIAMGETDLSDVPGYLSRYEELLKYLIENGGISGGDFEYVLYTLNQSLYTLYTTAEKPVKSAILKGNTLVNLMVDYQEEKTVEYGNPPETPNVANMTMLKPNTEYTLFYKAKYQNDGDVGKLFFRFAIDGSTVSDMSVDGTNPYTTTYQQYVHKFTTPSTIDYFIFRSNGHYFYVKECVLLEGDHTNEDIPYFEGMQSVKMPVLTTTGKNLFDKNKLEKGEFNGNGEPAVNDVRCRTSDFIRVKGGSKITLSKSTNEWFRVFGYDNNKNFVSDLVNKKSSSETFAIPSNVCFIKIKFDYTLDIAMVDNIQLEVGDKATSYEPHKSNILSTPEDLELHGIGDVKDTLDCLTGEMTERIGEIVLDGSENWKLSSNGYFWLDNRTKFNAKTSAPLCDKLISTGGNANYPQVPLFGNLTTVDEFKTWLSENNVKMQYQLETESVKTVDLTVVDQDNQPTQLGTFENVTHVSLVAENLIPEVEMEVATRISTELASASPLMDDISNEQQQLEATVDEQSENVDATMIATTEIFEEIL